MMCLANVLVKVACECCSLPSYSYSQPMANWQSFEREKGRERRRKIGKQGKCAGQVEHYCGYCRTKFVNETETTRNDFNEEMTWARTTDEDGAHDERARRKGLPCSTDDCQIRQMYAKTAQKSFQQMHRESSSPQGIPPFARHLPPCSCSCIWNLACSCCLSPALACCVLCFAVETWSWLGTCQTNRQRGREREGGKGKGGRLTERLMCNNYPKLICLFAPAQQSVKVELANRPTHLPFIQSCPTFSSSLLLHFCCKWVLLWEAPMEHRLASFELSFHVALFANSFWQFRCCSMDR